MQNKQTKQAGYTLIEVMITLTILAIIAAIAIPAYQGYIATAREAEGHNNLAALQMSEEEFFLENNNYFVGGDWSTLQTNSAGLWTRTGSDGSFNFDYAVALSGGGYVATATGVAGGKAPGIVLTVNKQ